MFRRFTMKKIFAAFAAVLMLAGAVPALAAGRETIAGMMVMHEIVD